MKILTSLFLVIVIVTVIVAGCTSPQPVSQPTVTPTPATPVATTPAPPAVPLALTRNWIVITMGIQDGTAITYPTAQISLTFNQDGTLAGYGGCNNYNGPFTVTGQTTAKGIGLTVGPLVSTKKYCQAYSNQETMYLAILQKAIAYNVNGNQLSITDQTGNVLVYQTQASLVTTTQYPHPA
jgi:heat shock protein HslJ